MTREEQITLATLAAELARRRIEPDRAAELAVALLAHPQMPDNEADRLRLVESIAEAERRHPLRMRRNASKLVAEAISSAACGPLASLARLVANARQSRRDRHRQLLERMESSKRFRGEPEFPVRRLVNAVYAKKDRRLRRTKFREFLQSEGRVSEFDGLQEHGFPSKEAWVETAMSFHEWKQKQASDKASKGGLAKQWGPPKGADFPIAFDTFLQWQFPGESEWSRARRWSAALSRYRGHFGAGFEAWKSRLRKFGVQNADEWRDLAGLIPRPKSSKHFPKMPFDELIPDFGVQKRGKLPPKHR